MIANDGFDTGSQAVSYVPLSAVTTDTAKEGHVERDGEPQDAFEGIVSRAKVKYRTVGDMVTSIIREAILTAAFRPGEYLRQDELARRLDVSRMPVRSALLQLESEGLVEFHPHRGAIVSQLDADQVRQMYEIRCHLEILAVEKAIRAMTPERLARLSELADQLDAEQEGERFLGRRVDFYDYLYDKDDNPMLVALIERLRSDVGRYWLRLRLADDGHAGGHRELLTFVERADVEGAQKYLGEHLGRVRDRLCELIEESRHHDEA